MEPTGPLRHLLSSRILIGVACVAFAAVLFAGNGRTPLFDQDEGAYAGFAQTMLRTGDWTEPHFIGSEKHRKPPLHFWLMAGSMRVLGETEFAVRLHGTLSLLLTCLVVYALGRRVFGEPTARVAALLLMTSAFANAAKIAITDPLLLLFETTAVLAMLIQLEDRRLRWALLACASIALGLLTKGPPVLILTGGLFVLIAVFHPRRRALLRLHPWVLLPVACLPLLAWGLASWRASDGDLVRWMLDWYVLRRLGGTVFGQWGPPGFYLATFFVGLFPWAGFLPAALVDAFTRARRREPHAIALAAWLASGWLFWELLPSKLPRYALGAYPALAFVIADQVLRLTPQRLRERRSLWWGVHLQAALGLVAAACVAAFGWRATSGGVAWSCVFTGALLGGSTLAWLAALRRGRLARGLVVAGAGTLGVSLAVSLWVSPSLAPWFGVTRVVAGEIDAMAPPDATVVFASGLRTPSLAFYLGRRGIACRERRDGEPVDRGGASDPHRLWVFRRPERFERFLEGRPDAASLRARSRHVDGWRVDKLERVRFSLVPLWAPGGGGQAMR